MELNLITFLFLIFMLVALSSNTLAASTTNGKLLKFYPITKQQYRDILALTKQQSTIHETDVMETHRSLADWSNSLHSSWNTLFNVTGDSLNKSLGQKEDRAYPICVIKTQDHMRRKRGARQYDYNNGYAGLAPNVVYPGFSYYGRPPYHRQSHYGYPQYGYYQTPYEEENIDDEAANDGEDTENNETAPEEMPNENGNVPDKESNSPIINCVVIIRRKNQVINKPINPETDISDDTNDVDEYSPPSYGHSQYPHYPYPYPPQHLPLYPYPPHGHYPYSPHHHPYGNSHPSSRSNKISDMNPGTMVQYQQMIAEYYRHLHALYMADATTGIAKSHDHPDYFDDDLEEYDDKEIGQSRE
ncbi:uncharacterized protein LOC124420671 [Lucilia cuprina]|uniref:uncharacterized protein LOC124420671 n=1 Tax=Lucilia cuprina TaxID=7375 RepID=UPI001F06D781|nr:uncharacterized protein LOC124420671 [Lucilia cuprina]